MDCDNYQEFKAKVHCIRLAFEQIFTDSPENREYFKNMGKDILEILLNHSLRVTICVMKTLISRSLSSECFVLSLVLLSLMIGSDGVCWRLLCVD
jgi:hypothetical protein